MWLMLVSTACSLQDITKTKWVKGNALGKANVYVYMGLWGKQSYDCESEYMGDAHWAMEYMATLLKTTAY